MTGVEIRSVAHADGSFTVDVWATASGWSPTRCCSRRGAPPNLDDLGLETVGLDSSARTLDVDERMRAGEKLWAIGDVTGKGAFTHMSMYQSAIALRDVTGEDGPPARYHAVPHTTFTDPEVGGVGMTEKQARDAGLRVRIGKAPLEQSSRGFVHGPGARGLIKVVEDADRGVLVGATAMGPPAARSSGSSQSRCTPRSHGEPALDDLRLPHLPPGHRDRAHRSLMIHHSRVGKYRAWETSRSPPRRWGDEPTTTRGSSGHPVRVRGLRGRVPGHRLAGAAARAG